MYTRTKEGGSVQNMFQEWVRVPWVPEPIAFPHTIGSGTQGRVRAPNMDGF